MCRYFSFHKNTDLGSVKNFNFTPRRVYEKEKHKST